MADTKRQLILDLLANNKMGAATEDAGKDLDKLGKSVDDTNDSFKSYAKGTEDAAEKTDKFGNTMDETKGRIAKLQGEIDDAKAGLGEMSKAFADTDDAAERIDLSKGIRKSQANIRNLTKNKSILEDLIPDDKEIEEAGNEVRQGLVSNISNGISGAIADNKVKSVIIGGIVALLPNISGIIGAAVAGGAGVGGIIGGVILASKNNAQIQASAKAIGKSFTSVLSADAGKAFTAPISASLGDLQVEAQRVAPTLGALFTQLAPKLEPLVDSIIKAANDIGGGPG